jgi:hypothetical protein
MEICKKIEDIIWGESTRVWDDTFTILVINDLSVGVIVNVVMKWALHGISEFQAKYSKALKILTEARVFHEGVEKLVDHYKHIMLRYKTVYECCRAMEFSL